MVEDLEVKLGIFDRSCGISSMNQQVLNIIIDQYYQFCQLHFKGEFHKSKMEKASSSQHKTI